MMSEPKKTNPVTALERVREGASNQVLIQTVFGALGFYAPKVLEAIIHFFPKWLLPFFPTLNIAIGAGVVLHIKRGVAKLWSGVKSFCGGSSDDNARPLLGEPSPSAQDSEKSAELGGWVGVASTHAAVYTALNTIMAVKPDLAEAINEYLPPVATPLFLAKAGYEAGKVIAGMSGPRKRH